MKSEHSGPDIQHQTYDWGLWFYWISATTSGWLIGSLFFSGIPLIISGVLIAALQWAVLYKRIDKAWQWFILSSAAWTIGMIIVVLFLPQSNLLQAPILGCFLGAAQWAILRKHFYWAGWWIPISILAWTTGLTLMPGLFTTGALPGALTGITLVILFKFSFKSQGESEVQNEIQTAWK